MKKYKNLLSVSVLTLGLLVILAGCSNDGSVLPTGPDKEITIQKVTGLMLFRNGKVSAFVDESGVQGTVIVQMNENSDIFEVEFFDENGEILTDDAQQYKLTWNNDTEYATFEHHSNWEFYIYGKKRGETTFELQLKSLDFTSPAIPLVVK